MYFLRISKKEHHKKKRSSDPFNEIVNLDNRSIQKVIQKTVGQDLVKALKSTDDKVQNKIFHNMSKRGSTMLKEDMEYMGPVRLIDVLDAQRKIFSIVYHLANTGEITIPEDFLHQDKLDQAYEKLYPAFSSSFKDIEEFAVYLTERHQGDELYGFSLTIFLTN